MDKKPLTSYSKEFLKEALNLYTEIKQLMSADEIVDYFRDLEYTGQLQKKEMIVVGARYYIEVGEQEWMLRDTVKSVRQTSRKW